MAIDPNTDDITVENLTVTEDAVATRLNVPESASVNTLAAAEIKVRNLTVNQDAEVENLAVIGLTAAEGAIESLTVSEAAAVGNINVLEDTVTERLDVYTSASINALTAANVTVNNSITAEQATLKNINVNEVATVETLTVSELLATDATIENVSIVESADLKTLSVAEGTTTHNLTVANTAKVDNLTVTNVAEAENLTVTNAAEVERLTAANAVATRATVHDAAYIHSLYVDGIKCGEPHGFAELSAPGQLWTEVLFADTIRGEDITLKGPVTIQDGSLSAFEEEPLLIGSDLATTGDVTVGGALSAEDLSCFSVITPVIKNLPSNSRPIDIEGNTTLNGDTIFNGGATFINDALINGNALIRGDLEVTGRINNEYAPVMPYVAIPSDHPDFEQFTDADKVDILLSTVADLINALTEARLMHPTPEPTNET